MQQRISNFFSTNRKFLPLMSTALLALVAYAIGAYLYRWHAESAGLL